MGPLPLNELAERFDTPLYVYDLQEVDRRCQAFHTAFRDVDFLLAYSVKANGNLAVLRRLASLGSGADIVSGGELHRCLAAGMPAERIYFAGVGKRRDEMVAGLEAGIGAFHVESAGELSLLGEVARASGATAPVGIRVNPDILSPTFHEYTRTGHAASKFGVPMDEARDLFRWAWKHPSLDLRGAVVHIGSQILDPAPYLNAQRSILQIVRDLKSEGIELEYADLGGGFGVGYQGDPGLDPGEVAALLLPELAPTGLRLLLEPGRSIVGEAGILLVRVLYVKRSGGKVFVVTDGGMTELLRPSHYGGFHRVEPVEEASDRPTEEVDVVGPVCESGDFLARERALPLPEPGEVLAVRTAGAYGFTMASNYNSRCRPAEVVVDGTRVHLARRRESLDDLIQGESIPDWPEQGTDPSSAS